MSHFADKQPADPNWVVYEALTSALDEYRRMFSFVVSQNPEDATAAHLAVQATAAQTLQSLKNGESAIMMQLIGVEVAPIPAAVTHAVAALAMSYEAMATAEGWEQLQGAVLVPPSDVDEHLGDEAVVAWMDRVVAERNV